MRQSIRPAEFLHLAALNAFALVQPILERLAANPGFLQSYRYSGVAVCINIAVLLTAIPVSVFAVITVLRWCAWNRSAIAVLGLTIGLLSVMSLLIVARWLSVSLNLLAVGIPDSGPALVAVFGGMATVWMYFRSETYRQILSLCAAGVILFPVSFFGTAAIREEVLGISARQYVSNIAAKNPAPVVVIVFDGFCGMALLNEKHEIDRIRYPAFARLGDMSSFYRNATTVHTRTDHALPAILSSCRPEEIQVAVEADYPTNLFRLVYNTGQYDMTVFEPYTHLCPKELQVKTRGHSLYSQTGRLLNTLLRVYAKISIPQDLASLDVKVSREWFGMLSADSLDRDIRSGRMAYPWDMNRDVQCRHFVDCLECSAKPGFRFLHVAIPHDPWTLMPSGKSNRRFSEFVDPVTGRTDDTWSSDELLVNMAWQRYLLQLQFADAFLGRVLDRLDETGQMDEALIVVTADHGMAFVPGLGCRTPSAETIPDIVSVPLFIKRPQQNSAVVSDENVETVDILPTITEIIGLPNDGAWEGTSLVSHRAQRLRKTVQGVGLMIHPDFPQRFHYVDRMIRVFGSGSDNDRLWNLHTIPELAGAKVSHLAVGPAVDYHCELFTGGTELDSNYPDYVPCCFRGRLSGPATGKSPRQLALSLNGVIMATTRESTDRIFQNEWTALLPDSAYRPDGNQLRLFEVKTVNNAHILHEIRLEPFPS